VPPDNLHKNLSVALQLYRSDALYPEKSLRTCGITDRHLQQGVIVEYNIGRNPGGIGKLFAFFPEELEKVRVILQFAYPSAFLFRRFAEGE
jgi:hypothetical protein